MYSTIRFINNEFIKGVDGKTFESINPSTEKPIVAVHEATEKDVDIAVAVARKTFETTWKHEPPVTRVKCLLKLADLFEENLELLASIESLDNGKAISMAKGDIGACVGCLRYYGGWADKIEGKVIDSDPDTFSYTKQEPVSIGAIPLEGALMMKADSHRADRCLRSNHPMELSTPHVGMEDWPRCGLW